ncbi:MAG: maleylpyruvate isomerase N-terminal domain-containing protein [Acidimicrobiales bacterium]
MTAHSNPEPWLDALAGSHDRLCDIVGGLGVDGLRRRSYCDDWTIAQVLSHLGSGAEIFQATLDAALAGDEPPGSDTFPAIWDRWNAMTPEQQAEEFVSTDGALVESLERLGDRLEDLEVVVFGSMHVDAVGFLGLRLSEHALHAWDVAVVLDRAVTVDGDAVALLVDRLPLMAQWAGRADGAGDARPLVVTVCTTDPARRFVLRVDDAVSLTSQEESGGELSEDPGSGAAATLDIGAEPFLRLVYGRLDTGHSPAREPHELLDLLRGVFQGL